jgi:hypothetical protein
MVRTSRESPTERHPPGSPELPIALHPLRLRRLSPNSL